jgi:23S rRNA pseudouridine1911/1915/1917 synthase
MTDGFDDDTERHGTQPDEPDEPDEADGADGADESPAMFVVPALADDMRLDRVLALVTGISRSEAVALVGRGAVTVNGEVATGRRVLLHQGDVVTAEAVAAAAAPPAEPGVAIRVVYDDDQVVVVDKPAGLVVHPGAGHLTGTMVGGLLARYPDLAALSDHGVSDPGRPGIVHRLDKGTSGLLVVARTPEAVRSLSGQLAARTVERRYLAAVAGHVAGDRGEVEAPIGRSTRSPTRMAVTPTGRPARTTYRVLGRLEEPAVMSLLVLTLETGRTHQIRVHLAAIGHPVIGDDRYGPAQTGPRVVPAGRLFLHAARLGFAHPADGRWVSWDSPLPAELATITGDAPAADW